jgi:uncharacterized protein (DUF305 family)
VRRLSILAAWWVPVACAAPNQAGPAAPPPAQEAGSAMAAHEAMAMEHELPATAGPGFTVADVRFMQNMIGHHAQALVMAAMVPTHGADEQLRKLAEKIDISQRDEIAFMERWLRERHQAVPAEHDSMHMMHAMQMPGMLSPEQMEQLDAARDTEFERLFLTFMIQHHRGALQMVETLFASPGAAQDSDIFRFVTDVDTDQRAEIFTMQSMLAVLGTASGSSPQ